MQLHPIHLAVAYTQSIPIVQKVILHIQGRR
jgi:hypothetical protein